MEWTEAGTRFPWAHPGEPGDYDVRRRPEVAIRAVISDFGGVLTTPLLGSFPAFQDETGISAEALGRAMQRIAERDGEHPLFELERGRITEADFLDAAAGGARARARPPSRSCTASARSTSRRSTRTSR